MSLPINIRMSFNHRRPILTLRIPTSHANNQRTFHSVRKVEHHGIAFGYPIGRYGKTTQSIVRVYVHPRLVEDEVELLPLSILRVIILVVIGIIISIIIIERMSLDSFQPMSQRQQVGTIIAPRWQFDVQIGTFLLREVVRRTVHGEGLNGGVGGEEGRVSISLVYVQVYD